MSSYADELEDCRERLVSFMMRQRQTPDQAEDLAQETLIRAWRFREKFRNDCSLYNWLCQICMRLLLSRKRMEGRRAKVVASLDEVRPDTDLNWEEFVADPVDDYGALDSEAAVEQFTLQNHLSKTEQVILFSGETTKAMADLLGIPRGTVISKQHRLRQRLKPAAMKLVA